MQTHLHSGKFQLKMINRRIGLFFFSLRGLLAGMVNDRLRVTNTIENQNDASDIGVSVNKLFFVLIKLRLTS